MSSDRPETFLTRLSAALRVVLGVVLSLLFLAIAAFLPGVLGLPPLGSFVGFLLALVVLTAAYGLQTHPLYAFGVRRHVGYAIAREGRCDECGDAIAAGERRRYARQVVAFGVPLYTLDWGVNTYCYDCRTDENDRASGHETRQYERETA